MSDANQTEPSMGVGGFALIVGEHQKVWGSRGQQLLRLPWEAVLVGEGHAPILGAAQLVGAGAAHGAGHQVRPGAVRRAAEPAARRPPTRAPGA